MEGRRSLAVGRTLTVAALVVLAGCGILGGGGGGSTATPTASPNGTPGTDATPAPTPTPTPTPAPTPTATPLPPSVETVTASNASLGLVLEVTANASVLEVATDDLTPAFADAAALQCARASPFAGVATNVPVADVTVRLAYDPGRLPPNASEDDLAAFAYNRTVERFVRLNGTVDADNDTVVATGVDASQNTFVRGDERLRVTLDGVRLDTALVVMHEPTYRAAVETGEVVDRCRSDGSGGTDTPAGNPTTTTNNT